MSEHQRANLDQATLWNGSAGHAWVELQSLLDEVLAPFERLLIQHVLEDGARRVLDIGCGAGSTTLAMARRLGNGARCVGIDISDTLLEVARRRAIEKGIEQATFVHADAQTHAFEASSFDAVISRFGVMFFEDPVAAFTNIRHATRSGGMLTFVAWRSPAENPFMTAAARAAAPLLPSLRVPDPNAPGQFGFADPDKVRRILDAGGWKGIDISPIDVPASLSERDLLTYVTTLGPVGLALREVDEQTRVRTTAVVRAAFDPFVQDSVARFNAACWRVRARAT
jgi:SAM-dependent methyltransferase